MYTPRNRPGNRSNRNRFILLAAVILIVGLIYLVRMTTYAPSDDSPAITPQQAAQSQAAVEQAEQELGDVRRAAQAGKRTPFKVSIKQEDLTTYMRSDPTTSSVLRGRKVEKPKVQFNDRNITTSAYMTIHGRRVYVTVTGRLSQSPEGPLVFHSESVMFGRFSAPGAALSKVDEVMNDYISTGKLLLPADITQINAENGVLTLQGVSSPKAVRDRAP